MFATGSVSFSITPEIWAASSRYKSSFGRLRKSVAANICAHSTRLELQAKERRFINAGSKRGSRLSAAIGRGTKAPPTLNLLRHHLVDHGEKWVDVERLRQIIACACGKEALDLARRCIRAQDDNWNLRGRRIALQLAQHFGAMHIRQIQIEQDQLRSMRTREFDTASTGARVHQC